MCSIRVVLVLVYLHAHPAVVYCGSTTTPYSTTYPEDDWSTTTSSKTTTTEGQKTTMPSDPCDPNPCENGGTCEIDFGSGTFSCICSTEWQGKKCAKASLYPHGASVNDVDLIGSGKFERTGGADDAFPEPEVLQNGFHFMCTRYRTVFTNVNGYLTLGSGYKQHIPQVFPVTFNETNTAIIAPFWADFDSVGKEADNTAESTLWFHEYVSHNYTAAAGLTRGIMERVQTNVKTYAGDIGFNPTTVIILTWANMVYAPYTEDKQERAYFQAVLAEDIRTYRSYVLFLYESTHQINPTRQVSVGYSGKDQPQHAYNHFASLKSVVNQIDSFNGNTGVPGKYVFSTSNCAPVDAGISDEAKCLKWHDKESNMYSSYTGEIAAKALQRESEFPICPCTYGLALNDGRFIVDTETLCGISIFARHGSYGQRCCYDNSTWPDQPLITRPGERSGSFLKYNPYAHAQKHHEEDVLPRQWCCNTIFCNRYFTVRPVDKCVDYKPQQVGWMLGDPHFTTVDGLSYTFNGVGEFWMINSSAFQLQARTLRAWDEQDKPASASIFGAFSAKDFDTEEYSPRVHVSLNKERTDLIILIDNGKYDFTNWFKNAKHDAIRRQHNLFMRKKIDTRHENRTGLVFLVTFPSEIMLNVTFAAKQLSILVGVTDSLKGNINGMLGNYNGDPHDDLTAPDGSQINSSYVGNDTAIYFGFAEHWRTDAKDSLFFYADTESPDYYQKRDFVPVLDVAALEDVENVTVRAQLEAICGTNKTLTQKRCLYDYWTTGDEIMASNTFDAGLDNENIKNKSGESTAVIKGDDFMDIIVGTVNYFNVTVEFQEDIQSVELSLRATPAEGNITKYGEQSVVLRWDATTTDVKPEVIKEDGLRFYGTDDKGNAATELVVTMRFCDCGWPDRCASCIFTDDLTEERIVIASHDCKPPWLGKGCRGYDPCRGVMGTCIKCIPLPEQNFLAMGMNGSGYTCECEEGFQYQYISSKCIDVDECESRIDNCKGVVNGSDICTNTDGSYICGCKEGFQLDASDPYYCEDKDECATGNHDCDHLCNNTIGSFVCGCFPHYTLMPDGKSCNGSAEDVCKAKGIHCTGIYKLTGDEQCSCGCKAGTELDTDNTTCININECLSGEHDCEKNCSDGDPLQMEPFFTCFCPAGFEKIGDKRCKECDDTRWGVDCEYICTGCANGTCDPVTGCEACENAGFQGPDCDDDVDECTSGSHKCGEFTSCSNAPGTYICECDCGRRSIEINSCTEIINFCEEPQYYEAPCMNGGVCESIHPDDFPSLSELCHILEQNFTMTYTCNCSEGYSGDYCEEGCPVNRWGENCTEMCENCANNTKCLAATGCEQCADGWTESSCDVDVDECSNTSTCGVNGVCTNYDGSYDCSCRPGFMMEDESCIPILSSTSSTSSTSPESTTSSEITTVTTMTTMSTTEHINTTHSPLCSNPVKQPKPPAVCPGCAKSLEFRITSIQWSDDLADPDSAAFKELNGKIQPQIQNIYACSSKFQSILVGVPTMQFRKGSVICKSEIVFTEEVDEADLVAEFQSVSSSGLLDFESDPDYIVVQPAGPATPRGMSFPILAVIFGPVACVLLIITGLSVILFVCYKRDMADMDADAATNADTRSRIMSDLEGEYHSRYSDRAEHTSYRIPRPKPNISSDRVIPLNQRYKEERDTTRFRPMIKTYSSHTGQGIYGSEISLK